MIIKLINSLLYGFPNSIIYLSYTFKFISSYSGNAKLQPIIQPIYCSYGIFPLPLLLFNYMGKVISKKPVLKTIRMF